ncbi:zygotic DNA replication licensing factor mcm3 [Galendromus occidentalis]|uniref:Zygotic DNA replication licensing factor mcm3 n=1 Tax=Galendromus occidentalis TaxID=34638 RepID=A0AAJ6VYJ5_9ACAR|nr:zygotic DNA replication licensing factor mcm3 [Galendromus occidentalis]
MADHLSTEDLRAAAGSQNIVPRKRKRDSDDGAASSEEEREKDFFDYRKETPETPVLKPKKKAREEVPEEEETPLPSTSSRAASIGVLDRLDEFRSLLKKAFRRTAGSQQMTVDELMSYLAGLSLKKPFTRDEVDLALEKMSDANQVMVSDDIVYLI